MDRATKTKLLIRYVSTLEDNHGSVRAAEGKGDKLFKEMRGFVKKFFENDRAFTGRGEGDFHWTEERESYLNEHYATKNNKEIAEVLGVTPSQIRTKAWRLGLKKPKDDKKYIESFIIKNHEIMSRKELAKALGIPYSSACYYLKRMKEEGKLGGSSRFEPGQKTWTEEEETYLAKHYPTTSASDVAKALGRSTGSVRGKASIMGIKKK